MFLYLSNATVSFACFLLDEADFECDRKTLVKALISFRRNIRVRHDIRREALLSFDHSPWAKLELASNDSAYRKVTGLSIRAFQLLSEILSSCPKFHSRFRNTGLTPRAIAGIVLVYMRNPCHEQMIQLMFGITRSAANRYINQALRMLNDTLSNHSKSRVSWPSEFDMERFAGLIAKKKECLRPFHVFGFVDGIRLLMGNFSDPAKQNAYYQFHEKSACVGNVVAFGPDGCCFWYHVNAPGSWHDSKIAEKLYVKLQNQHRTPARFRLVADSGFRSLGGKLLITRKEKTTEEQKAICSIRQSAEHSNNTIKSNWRRLELRLGTNLLKNKLIIQLAIFLTNFKVRVDGVGQVATYYSSDIPQIQDLLGKYC